MKKVIEGNARKTFEPNEAAMLESIYGFVNRKYGDNVLLGDIAIDIFLLNKKGECKLKKLEYETIFTKHCYENNKF